MKVLLINPWESNSLPPPSIGYLQAALKHWKVDVVAKNLPEAMIDTNDYDLVGVSFHSFSVKYARQIRDKFKGKLICGGHHPSALPEQMLSIGYDQVVVGEGENAIINIIQGNNNKVIYSKDCEHKYFYGINEIPIPDYTGLKYTGFSGDVPYGINIITSRGCPFSCNFCASSDFWKRKYTTRSSENVLNEINQRITEGFKTWIFEDDNFTANKKRVFEICSQLDGKLPWLTIGRAESLDEELCRELRRAGCYKIFLGIESLSQEVLDRCGKNTTVEKMMKGIEIAENAGIETISQFMVGLPGDTIKNIEETNYNLKRSKIKTMVVRILWILPNTEIHRKAKEHGFNDNIYLESGVPFYTYEQSMETLNQWTNLILNK
ncbi:MAG: B12-binding domain-containing radical SAM protein [Bacteroidales bacterium]|nr:B12-binding domain-containing radical SAM protein [Bacteroidales bacterium]